MPPGVLTYLAVQPLLKPRRPGSPPDLGSPPTCSKLCGDDVTESEQHLEVPPSPPSVVTNLAVQPLLKPRRPGSARTGSSPTCIEPNDHMLLRAYLRRNAARLPQCTQFAAAAIMHGDDLAERIRFVQRPAIACADDIPDAPTLRLLITAPHAATAPGVASRSRDPLSGCAAQDLIEAARRRGLRVDACIATLHRQYGDQNRAWGLIITSDVLPRLMAYDSDSSRHDDGRWRLPTIHLDVHTFHVQARRPAWGGGVNLIVLHGQPALHHFALRVAALFDREHTSERTMVLELGRRPHNLWDNDTNALCEISRARGAASILVELPVDFSVAPSEDDSAYHLVHSLPLAELMEKLLHACVCACAPAQG